MNQTVPVKVYIIPEDFSLEDMISSAIFRVLSSAGSGLAGIAFPLLAYAIAMELI
jgi:hypothetical protein